MRFLSAANGQYRLQGSSGVPPGTARVEIEAFVPEAGEVKTGPETTTKKMRQVVPPKYNAQSTLKVEIAAGKENQHDFDLKP